MNWLNLTRQWQKSLHKKTKIKEEDIEFALNIYDLVDSNDKVMVEIILASIKKEELPFENLFKIGLDKNSISKLQKIAENLIKKIPKKNLNFKNLFLIRNDDEKSEAQKDIVKWLLFEHFRKEYIEKLASEIKEN